MPPEGEGAAGERAAAGAHLEEWGPCRLWSVERGSRASGAVSGERSAVGAEGLWLCH